MRFVVMYTNNDFDNHTCDIRKVVFDNFEEMMECYTLLRATRDNVVVIETENQKVVCDYLSEGSVRFNKFLLER